MFTMQLHISMQSYIGQHLPILQHIVGVAVIRAVRTSPGYEVCHRKEILYVESLFECIADGNPLLFFIPLVQIKVLY